jgi:hypothetical protein
MSSNYDVAIVMDNTTLNSGMLGLYNNASAKAKLFSGNVKDLSGMDKLGITSVDWSIDASPTFTLTPPTQAQWTNKATFFPGQGKPPTKPPADSFQVDLSSFSTTLNMKSSNTPIVLPFKVTLFAEVKVVNRKVVLGPLGVLPTDVPPIGQLYLQVLAEIVYKQVAKLLAGFQIPATIAAKGFDFTTPVVTVTGSHLVVASNLTSTGAPDITGVTWPVQKLAILTSRTLLNAMLDKYKLAIIAKVDGAKVNHSDSNWAGSYAINGGISNAAISLDSTLPNIDVEVTVSAVATIGVSWWLVPAACAMETASNLI